MSASNAFYLDLVCILCHHHKVVDTRLVVRQLFNCLCDNFSASLIGCVLSLNFHLFGDSSIYLERLVWTGGALRIHWQSCRLILAGEEQVPPKSTNTAKIECLYGQFKMQKVCYHNKNWSIFVVCVGHSNFMSYLLCSQVKAPQPEREPSTWERRETGGTIFLFGCPFVCLSPSFIFDNDVQNIFAPLHAVAKKHSK